MSKLTVGIIGYGVLGKSFKKWLNENTDHDVVVSDPPLGINDDLTKADVFFISVHVPTKMNGKQGMGLIRGIINDLPKDVPIFVRTTIVPGTSAQLSKECGREVNFMPEFLTERTADEDFKSQPMVFTAHKELLQNVFRGQDFIEMSTTEAEIAKYAHNVFGALKVTYFNAIYDYCQKLGCDYENVKKGVLLSKYINETHTMVPGPDGQFGYGGKCFPKDTQSFEMATRGYLLNDLLADVENLNEVFRLGKNPKTRKIRKFFNRFHRVKKQITKVQKLTEKEK